MIDKHKLKDQSIWRRLGIELYFLDELLRSITNDQDFNAILPKQLFNNRITSILHIVGRIQSDADDRLFSKTPINTDMIYISPEDRKVIQDVVLETRKKLHHHFIEMDN